MHAKNRWLFKTIFSQFWEGLGLGVFLAPKIDFLRSFFEVPIFWRCWSVLGGFGKGLGRVLGGVWEGTRKILGYFGRLLRGLGAPWALLGLFARFCMYFWTFYAFLHIFYQWSQAMAGAPRNVGALPPGSAGAPRNVDAVKPSHGFAVGLLWLCCRFVVALLWVRLSDLSAFGYTWLHVSSTLHGWFFVDRGSVDLSQKFLS